MLDDPALPAGARRVAEAFANYPAPQRMAAFLEGVRAFHRFAPAHAAGMSAPAAPQDDDHHHIVSNVQ
jgi:hypothetical protein